MLQQLVNNYGQPAQFAQPQPAHGHGQGNVQWLRRFDALSSFLMGLFNEFDTSKQLKERQWIEDIEHYHSTYDAGTLAELQRNPNRSKVFFGLTKTKVLTAYARIIDIYFSNPLSDFWGIEPTAVPDLPPHIRQNMVARAVREVSMLSGMEPNAPELRPVIKARVAELQDSHAIEWREQAEEAADAMTREIRDIFDESNAEDEIKAAILECCTIGTGCIAGVTPKVTEHSDWMQTPTGWAMQSHQKLTGDVFMASCFELYPDPHCTNPKELERLFHRKLMTRQQVESLRKQPGFFESEINSLLMQNPSGNHVYKPWEQSLNHLAGVTALGNSPKYEVLIYWGTVPGNVLKSAGFKADPNTSQNVCVFMCGGYVLGARMQPNPRNAVPYHFFPYEMSTGRFWGTGVARSVRDSQKILNSAVRVYIDNTAISSGPIVEVNTDLIDPSQLSTAHHIFPWRVFRRTGGDDAAPAVRFYQPRSMSNHIMSLIDMMRRFADEESNLPSYTHGQVMPGLNKTATGMSMLMNASNVALKSVIKNIDMFGIKPLVESARDHVMTYSQNDLAKSGDIRCVVHGSNTLVAKELHSQRMMQFSQMTANPLDAPMTKRHNILRETAKAMDINPDDALLTEDELEEQARREQQQQQQPANAGAMGAPQQPAIGVSAG